MSNLQEKILAEGLKRRFIGVQKSTEIYPEMAKWERRVLLLDEREIERVAVQVAKEVGRYADRVESETGAQPTSEEIMEKIREELNKI